MTRIETPSALSSSLAYCVRTPELDQFNFPCRREPREQVKAHLDKDIPVAVVVERVRVGDLVLGNVAAAVGRLADQLLVRVRPLRVLVQHLHVRVGRGRIEVPVQFLDVLAVVALVTGRAEQAFLEDRVDAVPHGEREAEARMVVRESGDAVFSPAVGARAGVVVREMSPRVAVGRVVLADRRLHDQARVPQSVVGTRGQSGRQRIRNAPTVAPRGKDPIASSASRDARPLRGASPRPTSTCQTGRRCSA